MKKIKLKIGICKKCNTKTIIGIDEYCPGCYIDKRRKSYELEKRDS